MTSTLEYAVNDAQVVTPSGVFRGSVGINDGRIVTLDARPLVAHEVLEANGRVLLPGLIEPHGHFWDPGATDREDWAHGTAAAAAGGITTVIEMPLSIPPTVDASAFQMKLDIATRRSHVDFLLWGGVIPASDAEVSKRMEELTSLGAPSFKVFMCHAAREFPACDDGVLLHALRQGARLGVVMGIHAENDAVIEHLQRELQAAGRRDPMAHAESRPPHAEAEAIDRVIGLAAATGATIYIVHMSLAEGASIIREAKRRGQRVYVETCPQYLALDDSALREQGPWAKCAPPLRSAENTRQMWEYVIDGTIDTIGSDHAPFAPEEKAVAEDDIWMAPNGLTGIQTMLPLLIDAGVHGAGLSLSRLAEVTSTRAAQIFGLYPRKGVIAIGSDADLTLVDVDAEWTIRGADLLHKAKWTPYEGRTVRGRVDATLVRGTPVYIDETITVEPGFGRFARNAT
ncbi:MAG: allantoinase AllB [Chloroflexota bacterium]|nr:allantoinase AllB [Chloroflexota bacterium]